MCAAPSMGYIWCLMYSNATVSVILDGKAVAEYTRLHFLHTANKIN